MPLRIQYLDPQGSRIRMRGILAPLHTTLSLGRHKPRAGTSFTCQKRDQRHFYFGDPHSLLAYVLIIEQSRLLVSHNIYNKDLEWFFLLEHQMKSYHHLNVLNANTICIRWEHLKVYTQIIHSSWLRAQKKTSDPEIPCFIPSLNPSIYLDLQSILGT